MKLIALTDHDGFAGIEEMFKAIETVRETAGVEIAFVPGIEFSTNYYYGPDNKKKEIHILGYFPSSNYDQFKEYLEKLDGRTRIYMNAFQHNRILRIYEMVTKFNEELPSKVPSLAKLQEIQDPIITDKTVARGMRGSIAPGRLLTSTGIFDLYSSYVNGKIHEIQDEGFTKEYLEALKELCSDLSSAQGFMKKYFDKKEPSAKTGYIGLTESPEWAVKTILKMGGIPVLAHPAKYPELAKGLLSILVPIGLKGVEVVSDHFKDKEPLKQSLEFIKSDYPELTITIGSDCHGCSVDKKINYTPNNVLGLRDDFDLNISSYSDEIYSLFCQ